MGCLLEKETSGLERDEGSTKLGNDADWMAKKNVILEGGSQLVMTLLEESLTRWCCCWL